VTILTLECRMRTGNVFGDIRLFVARQRQLLCVCDKLGLMCSCELSRYDKDSSPYVISRRANFDCTLWSLKPPQHSGRINKMLGILGKLPGLATALHMIVL